MTTFTTSRTKLAGGAILLLAVLPFLNPWRYLPAGDYAAHAVVLLLGIALLWLTPTPASSRWQIRAPLLCLSLLPLLVVAGAPVSPYPGQGIAAAAALALALAVAHAASLLERQHVLAALAYGLLLGGVLQLAIGLVQVLGGAPQLGGDWLFYDPANPRSLFGQFGQRNHYANYLTLAQVSACYLYARGRLSAWLWLAFSLLTGLLLAWSGSRLAIGYGGAAMVLCWLLYRLGGREAALGRLCGALALAVAWMAFCQLYSREITGLLASWGLPLHVETASDRMLAGGFGARRLLEWHKAWQVFLAHPLFGAGWGGYAAESVRLELTHGVAGQWNENWLFTHSHNLLMQLLAETGLLGTLTVLVGLCWAFLPWFRRAHAGVEGLFVVLLAMVLLLHSMFEYPLWYLNFLGVFALLLGTTPARQVELEVRQRMRQSISWGLGALLLWQVGVGVDLYVKLARWYGPAGNPTLDAIRAEGILNVGRNPLWTYESDLTLSNYLAVDDRALQGKRELYERLAAYRPYAGALLHLAMLRALDGDTAGAQQALRHAIAAYPDYARGYAAELGSRREPALRPLQRMAFSAARRQQASGSGAAAASMVPVLVRR